MPEPYSSLTPAQVAAGQALVACQSWTWAPHTVGLRPDGALVEIVPGRAAAMTGTGREGLVPLLTDPIVVGHLLEQLGIVCGTEVAFTTGRGQGADEAAVYSCTLEAGRHRKTWTGTCLGEAVAQALVARWRVLERGGLRTPPRSSSTGPSHGMMSAGWGEIEAQ